MSKLHWCSFPKLSHSFWWIYQYCKPVTIEYKLSCSLAQFLSISIIQIFFFVVCCPLMKLMSKIMFIVVNTAEWWCYSSNASRSCQRMERMCHHVMLQHCGHCGHKSWQFAGKIWSCCGRDYVQRWKQKVASPFLLLSIYHSRTNRIFSFLLALLLSS